MSKPNIIHTVPDITKESSGPSYSVTKLCESLIDFDNELRLAVLDWEHDKGKQDYIRYFSLSGIPKKLGISRKMKLWFHGQAEGKDISIIHSHGIWQMNGIYAANAATKYKVQFVVSPRGTLSDWAMKSGTKFKKIFWPLLQRPALKQVNCFHATAESEYLDIRRLGFKQPVAIIPNGIDIPDEKIIMTPKDDTKTLLFLGRIHPKKGLDILLESWRFIQDEFPQWNLSIVGNDEDNYGSSGYLNFTKTLANNLGLNRVNFLGELNGEEKNLAYQQADIFILPTYSENFGVTVTESLAAGTPAIVSRGAPWESINTKNAGWSIDIGIEPLVSCLREALSLPDHKLKEIGINGRKWMIDDFSWPLIGEKMNETYKWLHTKKNRPGWIYLD